jgi:hypothetical protein
MVQHTAVPDGTAAFLRPAGDGVRSYPLLDPEMDRWFATVPAFDTLSGSDAFVQHSRYPAPVGLSGNPGVQFDPALAYDRGQLGFNID